MSAILDIDLDYFNLVSNPIHRLEQLLKWSRSPVDFVVEKHHQAFTRWRKLVRSGLLTAPTHILHVDEHHDMMDELPRTNIANFVYHAMRTWKGCRVHWLVEDPIDCPRLWLSDDAWHSISQRFTVGPHRPRKWPRPDYVSICSSPEFVPENLRRELLAKAEEHNYSTSRNC